MKKLLLLVLLLLPLRADSMHMIGFGAAGNCGGAQVMGYNTIGTNFGRTYQNAETLNVFTAPCTGTLTTAYAYHVSTDSETAKICVYLDDGDNDADSGDTKVACSGVISSAVDGEWASASFSGGAITQGSIYWVVLAGGSATDGWWTKWDEDTGSDYGHDGGNNVYTNEPATLGGTYSPLDRKYSAYVTVQ